MGAVPQDAQERVVPLVVDNDSLERPTSGEEGGHENGPRKGPLDGLACEQPSTTPSRQEDEDERSSEAQDPRAVCGPDLAAVDTGPESASERIELDERSGNKIKRAQTSVAPTIDNDLRISVHYKRHPGGFNGAALELQSANDNSDERWKRSRKTLDDDNDDDDEQPARRTCAAHRHRVSCHVAQAHVEPACRRGANRNRPCRVHDRRRDCSRGKSTERLEHRHLRFRDPENAIVRLEQDPILRPVRILGCPPGEGQEVSSFLEPAGPSYVYTGIGVGHQFAAVEPHCFALHNPNNILPKSRASSIARLLDGPNRAVKDINRKVLAMARAMTPAWSLRLLGVSCGSVICAWGLLLILSVLGGGASHGTGIGSFGLGMSGTMDDLNGARPCPWVCTCNGQEVDCTQRGLTQIPGDLGSLLIAEKL